MLGWRDGLMLAVIFSSIFVGIFFQDFSSVFRRLPMACMMAFLFMSFLSNRITVLVGAMWSLRVQFLLVLFLKLVFLPVAVFALCRHLLPEYALAALLLSGVSTGVVTPFFSDLLKGNTALVLLMLIGSSIFVPFTLPLLVKILVGQSMEVPMNSMMQLLCLIIFIPILLAECVSRWLPRLAELIRERQYPFALVLFVVTNLGVFSKYGDFFRRHPSIIFEVLGVAAVLAALYFMAGLLLAWKQPLADRLSLMIIFGMMNYVLVIVFSSEFFGPLEPTLAAVYSVPFFGLVVPLRLYEKCVRSRGMRSCCEKRLLGAE